MRHTGQSAFQSAGGSPFVLDPLESRRLLADASGIVTIEWRGQEIEMRQGEWIVALTRPDPSYDEETGKWIYNGIFSRSTTPTKSLDAALDAAQDLGVEFKKYLATEDTFLIKVPDGVSYQQLLDVIDDVPGFEWMEPNAIMRSGDAPARPRVLPEEEKTEEPVADDVPVTGAPAMSRFVMPANTAFSHDRIGGSDLLDGEKDEDEEEDELLK